MDATMLYLAITRYMGTKGWEVSPVTGTYCSGKNSIKNTCLCVSGCVGKCSQDTFLNVIVNHNKRNNEIQSVTLGILAGDDFASRKPSYRVDFNNKHGWHIDSSRNSHFKLPTLGGYEDYKKIIDLISDYGTALPYLAEANLVGL